MAALRLWFGVLATFLIINCGVTTTMNAFSVTALTLAVALVARFMVIAIFVAIFIIVLIECSALVQIVRSCFIGREVIRARSECTATICRRFAPKSLSFTEPLEPFLPKLCRALV
jgi:hypothetical protein